MKTIEFKIIGKSPMLFNKFNIEEVSNKRKPKSGSSGNDPDEWRGKVVCEGKKLYIPRDWIFGCISEGGNYIKEGRGTLKKKLMGCILVNQEKFFLNRELPKEVEELANDELPRDASHPVYLDIRAVRNPVTKGKNVRYRVGICPGWEANIKFEWDDTVISRDNIKNVIDACGKFVGLSDARTLGYGRFTVEDIKIY